jgi:hypothetical protein
MIVDFERREFLDGLVWYEATGGCPASATASYRRMSVSAKVLFAKQGRPEENLRDIMLRLRCGMYDR